jgi:[glutamine synthetase] adenylyltransferase / [glutamine synthetase]-adenylyl-L-tyrosine phosphorylase
LDPIDEISRSRFARRLLEANPALTDETAATAPAFALTAMQAELDAGLGDDLPALQKRLRRLRQRVLLRVMARDLSGRATLAEVCGTMSDLAECSLEACLRFARCEDLAVIGMGKLGGRELNVSSDIDLVFVHPGEPDRREHYERAGRTLIKLLSEVTEDGFAFRVDMRLRPYGDSGPLACNLEFLETYFISQGREWERYAWIKARALTGGLERELGAIVRPFVFRKYLDFATLGAMRRLHAEVRREVERRELAGNVKLGPGGIREIEFVAQALQLVRGGRDAELTTRPTLQVLSLLAQKNLLPEKAAKELSDAYVFLRHVEHRLQYLDDAQRHDLPEQESEDAELLAGMCGFSSWISFVQHLEAHRAAVTRHFQAVFAEEKQPLEAWPDHPRLAALRASQRYAALPEDSRRRLDAVVPALARAAASTPEPQETIARGADLIEAIASRAAYLALLAENPAALSRVARIIGASSWAAGFVARHPLLLDELLDDRVLYAPIELDFFSKSLRKQLDAHAGDAERQMNDLRELHQAQVFRLLAQDLAGLLTVEKLADHLSALTDLVLSETLRLVWKDLRGKHRDDPAFAVIAYGKLGGKELGYASDLDIIFLFDDADERAPEAYARLAQRMNLWLTTHTSAGVLFDTDLRLRPSGAAGLMVSSIEAFERYQEKDAWVWEHQALTRARYCAGDAKVGEKFESIREAILKRKREKPSLAKEILEMREKMHAAHPNKSELFDVKHDHGGMIDIEFAVQFLVLAYAHAHPSLTKNLGNIALLGMAAELQLIPSALAERCREAYREFRRLQHALRLSGARYARVPAQEVRLHAAAVVELWRLTVAPNP